MRHDDYEGYARIAAEAATPIQTGENLVDTYEMVNAIALESLDYVMPDIQRIGGVTGWLRAAALAQIGRGSEASTCLLLYKEPLGEMSTARLKVIRETTDGFRIAEEDLKLRGEGDVLGIRQSGLPGYRIARSEVHAQLIGQAHGVGLGDPAGAGGSRDAPGAGP